jgi:transcription-repair coupling factor (superfamily II helicase)
MKKLFATLQQPIGKYLSEHENLVAPAATHSLICVNQNSPILIVTTSTRAANELTEELISYEGSNCVINFPAWETLPHERLSPKSDTVTARFKALNNVKNSETKFVVCSIRALLQPIIANDLKNSQIKIKHSQSIKMLDLIEQLSKFGYTRSDLVEKRGDFAVRGGILDLFAPDQEHPIRIDFFGDEIDELSFFAISDQRSIEKIQNEILIFPCRELLIDAEVKKRAEDLGKIFPQIQDLTSKLSEGITFEGMESLAAGVVSEFNSILDYLPAGYQIWLIDEPRIRSRAADLIKTNQEFLEAAWSNLAWSERDSNQRPIDLSKELGQGGFYTLEEIKELAKNSNILFRNLNLYSATPEDLPLTFIDELESYANKYETVIAEIEQWHKDGFQVIFTASGNGVLKRFSELLNGANLPNRFISDENLLSQEVINLLQSNLKHGFVSQEYKFVIITDKDVTGQRSSDKDLARMPSRRKKSIDPLQLKVGDFVVHEQHGVGRYLELINRSIAGVSREYQ